MKREMKWGIIILLFIGVIPAGAQTAPKDAVLENWGTYTNPSKYPSTDPDLFKEYQFQFASEFSYVSYKEPSADMKERGPFYGVEGAYDWRPPEAQAWPVDVLHLDSHFNFGDIDYRSPDVEVDNLHDFMMEPRVWLGRDFSPFDFTRLTPYLGLGYRLLYDHLGEVSDIGGYDRLSEYLYAPVGVEIVNESVPGWQFGFNAEYDIFIQGWQTSYLSNISDSYPNLYNKQNTGYGLRGSFDVVKKMGAMDLFISPYVRYWNIHQSKTSTAVNTSSEIEVVGYEPGNNSIEIGIKLGVEF